MFKTMQALITDVEKALYQSAGPSVQVYSQDLIMDMIQDGFNHVFTKRWWPQFRTRESRILNGTTGYITVPLTLIKSYEDIRYVYGPNSARPLTSLPMQMNTLADGFNVGTTPRWIEGDATNTLRVWPNTAIGTILVVGRARPDPYIITDVVQMDPTLLKHFAAWSYFVDDGSNPAAAAKHQGLFETRLDQLENDNFNEPIMLDAVSERVPTEWSESRY